MGSELKGEGKEMGTSSERVAYCEENVTSKVRLLCEAKLSQMLLPGGGEISAQVNRTRLHACTHHPKSECAKLTSYINARNQS